MSALAQDWYSDRALTLTWWPLLATLLLHAVLGVALTINWVPPETESVQLATPQHVKATLIDAEVLRPKPKPKPRPKPRPTPRVEPKPVQAKPEPKVEPAAAEPQERPAARPQVEEPPARQSIYDEAAAREQAAQDMARAMAEEDAILEAVGDLEVAQGHVATIARAIENNWSRPPSARNGMQAELIIHLIPTGEVVSVMVDRSSGSSAFDRSAVNAVRKAERFPELKDLPSRVFEKHFRRLRLKFRPEDLRQ